MSETVDKRDRTQTFRARLAQALSERGMSQSALARAAGVDRSTVSQLLSGAEARLPNGQLVAEIAAALAVSADWLLGLTQRPETIADLMATSLTITEAPRALIDETIFGWHREAAGYKIRHVPATLPDMLKTPDMLRWEYEPQLGRSAEQAIGASQDRLGWMLRARSDYEIAIPRHEIEAFAHAEGYYRGLPAALRLAQIDQLLTLCDQLYPSLRIYLFDARRLFSAPVTVFGSLLAVLYIGRHYMAFRDSTRVASFSAHFDWLVREADTGAREFPALLRQLRAEVGTD
jgi:transcriptional regulator with XRE-family HTH domain